MDDLPNIVENPKIRGLANLCDFASARYVGFFSFALNYSLGGLDVWGYHLVNLVLHITTGFLVYALVVLLFRAANASPEVSSARLIALATALLFIAHPLQTQAVTYSVQRFTVLATVFYLLGVVAYLQWRLSSREGTGGLVWYGVALVATVLAMKSQELAFTLPVMLMGVELVFFGPPTKRQWALLIPFFLILPLVLLSRFDALGESEAFSTQALTLPWSDYVVTQLRVIVTYLRLLVVPVRQNLDYDYPLYHSLLDGPVCVSLLLLLTLGGAAVAVLWRTARGPQHAFARLAAFGILWFFITLLTECALFPLRDVILEHRLYLPSVGILLSFCVAYGWGAEQLKHVRYWRVIVILPMAAILLACSVATYLRNTLWQDDVTLWEDVVKKSPDKAKAHTHLGNAYRAQKRMAGAVREYQIVTQLEPGSSLAHYNLGVAYRGQRQWGEAGSELQKALNLKPNFPEARNELGGVYKGLGKWAEAVREYQLAVGLSPEYADAHNNLGVAYSAQGRLDEAMRAYETAVRLRPEFVDAHNNLGMAYADQGRVDDAVRAFQTAIRLQPDYADAHNNLGTVYSMIGRLDDAIGEYQLTLRLQPGYAGTHFNLGNNYKGLGRLDDAQREYEAALRIQPDFPAARQALESLKKDRR